MKRNASLPVIAILAVCVLFACQHSARHRHNISIRFSENGKTYKMQAYFNERKTEEVERYLRDQLRTHDMLAVDEEEGNAHWSSGNRTRLYINSTPGYISIKLKKRENSYASYQQVKDMCQGVAVLLKDH
ncbi:MAG TPA: hypothetical protein VL307_05660 [Chitinophagaceae bacterium]|nr:hypothetical protein [Chitinophagaceae bacterium]